MDKFALMVTAAEAIIEADIQPAFNLITQAYAIGWQCFIPVE